MTSLLPQPAVYIETNKSNGTLYIGSTSSLVRRHPEHTGGYGCHFTKKYHLHRLVWFKYMPDALQAHQEELRMKEWKRAWKIELIEKTNPLWKDLSLNIE